MNWMLFTISKRRVVFATLTILLTASIGIVVFNARQQPNAKHPKDWLTSVPRLGSKVKNLEIINPRIIRQGTDAPAVAFDKEQL